MRLRFSLLTAAVGAICSPDPARGAVLQVPTSDTAWTIETPLTGKALPCINGKIKIFSCQNVELLSFLPRRAIGSGASPVGEVQPGFFLPSNDTILVDIWGWSDSVTGREFAVVARSDGTAFVEVTDPLNPRYLGDLPLPAGQPPTDWRALKVYKNYAFVVAESFTEHGMQVFDLAQLRDVRNPPVVFKETARYNGVGSAHNLVVDDETGYLYSAGGSVGGETCDGGLHMIDVRDPAKPAFAGCYGGGYAHDAECVVYRGPDKQYQGREICLRADGAQSIEIGDVTDKGHPKVISTATYPNAAFASQGWLTDDQRYFFLSDAKDEESQPEGSVKTRTIVFDVSDLDAPVMLKEFYGTTPASDNNLYIRGRYMFQSNRTAGLRVIDVGDPKNPKEVGYFDTVPGSDDTGHEQFGTLTNYPFFKNGVIAVPSDKEGLFLVRFR